MSDHKADGGKCQNPKCENGKIWITRVSQAGIYLNCPHPSHSAPPPSEDLGPGHGPLMQAVLDDLHKDEVTPERVEGPKTEGQFRIALKRPKRSPDYYCVESIDGRSYWGRFEYEGDAQDLMDRLKDAFELGQAATQAEIERLERRHQFDLVLLEHGAEIELNLKAELERLRAQVAELTYARDAYLASYRESQARVAAMGKVVEAAKTIPEPRQFDNPNGGYYWGCCGMDDHERHSKDCWWVSLRSTLAALEPIHPKENP